MLCVDCGRKEPEPGTDTCFRCRVSSVGLSFHSGAHPGRTSWHQSKKDFMLENFGTTDDRELAARGIERVK